jgi:hypothetical protein
MIIGHGAPKNTKGSLGAPNKAQKAKKWSILGYIMI